LVRSTAKWRRSTACCGPVKLHYLWRPQLVDVADEMVLETAINGRADCIVTFNAGHFVPASKFGVDVIPPA